MKRRQFIALVGGTAVAWPLAARAQQPAVPVIGFLNSQSSNLLAGRRLRAFRQGLSETGYVEGSNVAIEYRWAENNYDRLPSLAADLAQRQVAVIVAVGAVNSALAAKAASATIPIVFLVGSDPVQLGLVTSLARPDGNLTGITTLSRELLAKRLEILREFLPNMAAMGLLVSPKNPNTGPSVRELQALARAGGWTLHVVAVATDSDFDEAFATLVRLKAGAFLHTTDQLFASSYDRMTALAALHRIPAIYSVLDAAKDGGLMSYGSGTDVNRLVGIYAGRILKGEKPANLPVQQATKVELIINLKTAKALGITVPLALLTRADEVIE